MNDLLIAKLVYDGGDEVQVPAEMGVPRDDQMQGTPGERLAELAGRVCYDSLGKGRPSFGVDGVEGYHDHILKVGHGSVLEHYNFTVQVQADYTADMLFPLFNRPGLTVRADTNQFARITLNPRVVLDWDHLTLPDTDGVRHFSEAWKGLLASHASRLVPHIIEAKPYQLPWNFFHSEIVEPVYHTEAWITLFLCGSRGFSHELVRHGDFTAISQRSTRFVDESESPWVTHPLEDAFIRDDELPEASRLEVDSVGAETLLAARRAYIKQVAHLETWLLSRGLDKTSARKQARGAARGYLGNALHTELIFSASVEQWKRMLRQRASVFADAEIREVFCKALPELKRSRYGQAFENWELADSPDGIGQIAVESKLVAV